MTGPPVARRWHNGREPGDGDDQCRQPAGPTRGLTGLIRPIPGNDQSPQRKEPTMLPLAVAGYGIIGILVIILLIILIIYFVRRA